jgi:prepilin-type N-terminal cleavage/methylation domain-containing protein
LKIKTFIKKSFGFTLVELLVVMSIIAILTSITVGTFVESQKKSRDVSRKANLKSLSEAINLYYADNGLFPATISFGVGLTKSDGTIYMKKTPKEASSGMLELKYEVSSTNKSFRLYTNLENDDDKDCYQPSCPNYSVSTGCCYSITSSNVGVTGNFP